MQSYLRAARAAAVLAAAVAAAAGCSSGGSGAASSSSSSGAGASPGQELAASVKSAQNVNSFTATTSVQATTGSSGMGAVTLNGTVSEQRQPTELVKLDIASMQAGGVNAGAMTVITTPSAVYMKMPTMSAAMHSTKPYIEIPLSELKSGSAMSALLNQAQSSNPLSSAQLLAGATNVKTVGTSTINGVSTTELEGSEPASAATAKLPANLRSSLGQQIEKAGISQIKFQAWVDGQHNFRKMIVNEVGKSFSDTATFTVTSINQPVQISAPPSSQVSVLPASDLNAAGM